MLLQVSMSLLLMIIITHNNDSRRSGTGFQQFSIIDQDLMADCVVPVASGVYSNNMYIYIWVISYELYVINYNGLNYISYKLQYIYKL